VRAEDVEWRVGGRADRDDPREYGAVADDDMTRPRLDAPRLGLVEGVNPAAIRRAATADAA
jgi:hypothetical protein